MSYENTRDLMGRRLLAALLSCQLRLASVDYTLRTYVTGPIDPSWGELAEQLLQRMDDNIQARMEGNRQRPQ